MYCGQRGPGACDPGLVKKLITNAAIHEITHSIIGDEHGHLPRNEANLKYYMVRGFGSDLFEKEKEWHEATKLAINVNLQAWVVFPPF